MSEAKSNIKRTGGAAKIVRAILLLGVIGGAAYLFWFRYQEVEAQLASQDQETFARADDFSEMPDDVETIDIERLEREQADAIPAAADFDPALLRELTGNEDFSMSENPLEDLEINTAGDGELLLNNQLDYSSGPAASTGVSRAGIQIDSVELMARAVEIHESVREEFRKGVRKLQEGADFLLEGRAQVSSSKRNEALKAASETFQAAIKIFGDIKPDAENDELLNKAIQQASVGRADANKGRSN